MRENLTPQQIKAAQMLAVGCRTYDIIYKLEISEATLYRWKKFIKFKELVNSILADELAETKFRMAHLANASLNALWDLVTHGKDHTRLAAVRDALKLTGIMHIPSPNVTQTVEYILKPDEEPETIAITNEAGETRIEDVVPDA